jgi:hypothetical protein
MWLVSYSTFTVLDYLINIVAYKGKFTDHETPPVFYHHHRHGYLILVGAPRFG